MKNKSRQEKEDKLYNNSTYYLKDKRDVNWLVVIYSVIALVFIYLMFVYDWIFIIPAAALSYLSHRLLTKKVNMK